MRKIKFRAWDKRFKKMLDFDWIKTFSATFGDFLFNGSKNLILMQYTGLEDKNGKEIYEGDIIKIKGWKYNCEIVYVCGRYELQMIHGKLKRSRSCWYLADYLFEVKIIGNVYQNPRLLEVKK